MGIDSARGYAVHDTKNYLDFKLTDYPLKKEEPKDVTVAISHCGTCGSDHHTICGGWGPLASPFCVTGHEIIGKVVQIGSEVTEFKVGQRVGIGAQSGSCGECSACKSDNEQYCPQCTDTYNSPWPKTGEVQQGGYATHIRAQEQFVFDIPEALKSEDAASMLCGGLTVFSPLVRAGVKKGSKVGVVGIGGLGHYAVLFAVAMGAEVTAFSHSANKKDDAIKMGVKHFVITDKGFEKEHVREMDLIISSSSSNKLPLGELLSCLDVHGKLVFVGMPEEPLTIGPQMLAGNGASFASSHIGSKKEAIQMLKLAAEQQIKPWISTMPMKDAAKSIQLVESGKVRYRTVLIQDIDA